MKNVPTLSLVALVAVAGTALTGTATAASLKAKTPPRHVICSKASTWIPADYNGGCYLTFSQPVRRIAYDALVKAGETSSQWKWGSSTDVARLIGSNLLASMKCSRGGSVGLVKLNRWQAGTCTWTETFGHYGIGDHPDHEWDCAVSVALRSSQNGKSRMKNRRLWMQWDVTGAPVDDGARVSGEFPLCEKDPSTDAWYGG